MSGFLWRLVFGVLLVRGVRLAARWAPTLALWGLAALAWPAVVLAWGLRRRGLAALEARWPHLRPGWWLTGAGALLLAASATARVAGGPVWARPEGVLLGLLVGAWYVPLGVATGALGALEALLYTLWPRSPSSSPWRSSWRACGPSTAPWCGGSSGDRPRGETGGGAPVIGHRTNRMGPWP